MNAQKRKSVSHKLDPKTASFLFTSSARVKHTRKLPSIDERSLIANPLNTFKQPTYILEQAVHLANDVEALRKELTPLRLQYESLRSTIDYTDTDQEDVDPLEEISRREGYSKLHRLQDDSRELESQMHLLNTTFVDKSRNDLNAYVTEQYQMRAQTEVDIADLKEAIEYQNKKIENKVDPKLREKILENDKKIKELKNVLSELKNDEKDLLDQHQRTFTTKPKKEELTITQSTLLNQLKSLQHKSSQKRVEFAKMQKNLASQKKDMQDVIQEQIDRANQEKSTEMYLKNYQKRVSSSMTEEDSEKEKEYIQSLVDFYRENDKKTELVRVITKRRYKRFHPASKDGEYQLFENGHNNENKIELTNNNEKQINNNEENVNNNDEQINNNEENVNNNEEQINNNEENVNNNEERIDIVEEQININDEKINNNEEDQVDNKEDHTSINENNAEINNENAEINNDIQASEKSSVTPQESENHFSNIDHVEQNEVSANLLNEEEEVNSAAQKEENEIENRMSDENVNEILMKNLENLQMNINA